MLVRMGDQTIHFTGSCKPFGPNIAGWDKPNDMSNFGRSWFVHVEVEDKNGHVRPSCRRWFRLSMKVTNGWVQSPFEVDMDSDIEDARKEAKERKSEEEERKAREEHERRERRRDGKK